MVCEIRYSILKALRLNLQYLICEFSCICIHFRIYHICMVNNCSHPQQKRRQCSTWTLSNWARIIARFPCLLKFLFIILWCYFTMRLSILKFEKYAKKIVFLKLFLSANMKKKGCWWNSWEAIFTCVKLRSKHQWRSDDSELKINWFYCNVFC